MSVYEDVKAAYPNVEWPYHDVIWESPTPIERVRAYQFFSKDPDSRDSFHQECRDLHVFAQASVLGSPVIITGIKKP